MLKYSKTKAKGRDDPTTQKTTVEKSKETPENFPEAEMASDFALPALSYSGPLGSFQWGGTISALFLLLLNRIGRRSHIQTNLLVLYLIISFPDVLFKILRGQFGRWIAFLAVIANLFFPITFPVSRFILFVIIPNWLANGLRDHIVGGVFCLIIGLFFFIAEIREIGGFRNCECSWHCFGYFLGILLLLLFTILYLSLGS